MVLPSNQDLQIYLHKVYNILLAILSCILLIVFVETDTSSLDELISPSKSPENDAMNYLIQTYDRIKQEEKTKVTNH